MKKFNQEIQVKVSVDTIAKQLLSTFKDEEKHREMLTECIIETALDKGTIDKLYSALHGQTQDVNFQIGDKVQCEEKIYFRKTNTDGESKTQEIGFATVREVNKYKEKQLVVEYEEATREGNTVVAFTEVDISKCSKVPV